MRMFFDEVKWKLVIGIKGERLKRSNVYNREI